MSPEHQRRVTIWQDAIMDEFDDHQAAPSAEELTEALERMPAWQVDVGELDHGSSDSTASRDREGALPTEALPHGRGSPADELMENTAPPPLHRILEALLFVGGSPLTPQRAAEVVRGISENDFHQAIDTLARAYRTQARPYQVQLQGHGYVLALRPRFSSVREKLFGGVREARLSQSAVDVLSLVAYKQPATRQEIDALRGANSGGVLRQLIRHGLVTLQRLEGDSDSRFVTTPRFLKLFGLTSLDDLPQTQDLQRL